MAKKEKTYKEALAEVEEILEKLQSSDLDIDRMEKDVKKASELIAYCRNRLRATEEKLNAMLTEENE